VSNIPRRFLNALLLTIFIVWMVAGALLLSACTAGTMQSASGGSTAYLAIGGKGGIQSDVDAGLLAVSWDNEKSWANTLTAGTTVYGLKIWGLVEQAKISADASVAAVIPFFATEASALIFACSTRPQIFRP